MMNLSQRLWWSLMGSVCAAVCISSIIAGVSVYSYTMNGVEEELRDRAERLSKTPWIPFRFIRYRPRRHIDDYALIFLNKHNEVAFKTDNWEDAFPQNLNKTGTISPFESSDGRSFQFITLAVTPDESDSSRWRRRGRDRDADERLAYGEDMKLVLGAEITTLRHDLKSLFDLLTIVGLSVILMALFLARRLRDNLLAPVNALSSEIEALPPHDIDARLLNTAIPDELMLIHHRINELLERLAVSRQHERRSIGDIAHELRTPLAALRSELEFASSAGDIPEERASFLNQQVMALHQRVDSLLLLMRLESGQQQLKEQSLSLAELLNDAWARQGDDQHQINLEAAGDFSIRCDAQLMAMVFDNLLNNAISYSSDQIITVSTELADDGLHISVSNASSGLDPGPCPQVFEPFWRDDQARESTEQHHGLGLALVQRVIKAHQAQISANVSNAAVFSIMMVWPADALDNSA